MSKYSLQLEVLDTVSDILQKWTDEWFKTRSQKRYTDRVEEEEEQKVRMWEHRVEFITKTHQWGTRTFRRLLAIGDNESLVVKASSILFDEVATRQSSYLDIWRTAMRHDKPFRQVQREKGVGIIHPDDFKSPDRHAQHILNEVQNAS